MNGVGGESGRVLLVLLVLLYDECVVRANNFFALFPPFSNISLHPFLLLDIIFIPIVVVVSFRYALNQ